MKRKIKKTLYKSKPDTPRPLTLKDICKKIPRIIYIITLSLAVLGILVTSFGITEWIAKGGPSNKSESVIGLIIKINDDESTESGKTITVNYDYQNQNYTSTVDLYKPEMKIGDIVEVEIDGKNANAFEIGKASVIVVLGITAFVSAVCVFIHTCVLIKKYSKTPSYKHYLWIIFASLAFASCAFGLLLVILENVVSGAVTALVGTVVFGATSWILFISDSKSKAKSKKHKRR